MNSVTMQTISDGSITSVRGFQAAGVGCGIKETGAPDLALVYSEAPCRVAGVFTTNRVKAAPVLVDQLVLAKNRDAVHVAVVNSGNANACTGLQGINDAKTMACTAAAALEVKCTASLVMSTGVIGRPLPMDRIGEGIVEAQQRLSSDGGHDAARAIMTTDTRPKELAVKIQLPEQAVTCTIAGMAKGAGMIHPNMATMLSVITTDAAIASAPLQQALGDAVKRSFNMITVDGDTSTNDTVLLLANGLAGNDEIADSASPEFTVFRDGLTHVCTELAKMIVRDGEGATKFVEITVKGAPSFADARQVAMSVANSNLVKTALFGQDPNWGRVLAAVGYSGVEVDPARIALWFAPGGDGGSALQLVRDGQPCDVDEQRAREILSESDIAIIIDLGLGTEAATVWTCDLSYEYVKVNAAYTT